MTAQATTFFAPSFGRNDVQILSGTFDDFSFAEVLQVMGLSRQCLRFLVNQSGSVWSEILVKAGRVLFARAGNECEPQQVFRVLAYSAVKGSGLAFAVFHTEPTGAYPEPVGELARLCDAASASASASAISAAASQVSTPSISPLGSHTDSGTLILERPYLSQQVAESMPTLPASTTSRSDASFMTQVATPASHAPANQGGLELYGMLAQRLDQVTGQMHALEARVNAMPQLLNAEMRLALAQHVPVATTAAPSAPAISSPQPTIAAVNSYRMPAWIGALLGVLAAVCVVLLVLMLQRVR